MLIEDYDCSIDARNDNGETPLHLSSRYGRVSVVKYLLTLSVDVTARDKHGMIPLDHVIENGYSIFSLFAHQIKWDLDIKVRDNLKVFIVGNSAAGKSSLTAVIKHTARGTSSEELVSGAQVQSFTAGIFPTQCDW